MDPKLTEQLQQMLAGLLASAQDASVWAKGQIPLLVQEKILLGRVELTLYVVIGVAVLGIVLPRLVRFCLATGKACAKASHSEDMQYFVQSVVSGIASLGCLVLGLVLTLDNLHELAMAWFAPRLYIVEWLMSQIHK